MIRRSGDRVNASLKIVLKGRGFSRAVEGEEQNGFPDAS
jgi:hypothetical protein